MKTSMKKRIIEIGLSTMLLLSCHAKDEAKRPLSAGMPAPSDKASKTAPIIDGSADSKNPEGVEVPTNISGALLTCAIRQEATANHLETEIGCRLADATTGKKIQPYAKLSFGSNDPVRVLAESQPDASIYHVLYRIKGASHDEIRQIAQTTEAIVLYDKSKVKQDKIYNVLKPAIVLDDYEAPIVREQAIDKDNPGSL